MKVCFLDRDGVINVDTGYINNPCDIEIYGDLVENLKILQKLGYFFIIITNQSGIARGLISIEQYNAVSTYVESYLSERSVPILDTFVCPHHIDGTVSEYSVNCDCRKPKPGLLYSARDKYNLDLKNCIFIGDNDSDIQAGIAAGVGHCFRLVNNKVKESQPNFSHNVSSIKDAVTTIINFNAKEPKC